MNNSSRDRGFRVFRTIAAFAGAWAMAVAFTGGFAVDSPFIHLSSRSPRNATIIAAVSAAIAWALTPAFRRRQWLTTTRSRTVAVFEGVLSLVNGVSPRVAPVVAGAASVTILMIGLLKGAQVAAGSDAYGYASQADLWVHGMLRVEQPLMDEMTWPVARLAMAPLGYRPGSALAPA